MSFDERLNRHVQKCQMDTNIRYWDKKKSIVETCYLYSQFLLRPNAQNLFEAIIASIAGLDKSKLIQLTMDGPTVHWNVLELLDDYLLEKGDKKSFNIGSCSQHIIHGSFQTGVTQTKWEINQMLKGLFWLHYESPA